MNKSTNLLEENDGDNTEGQPIPKKRKYKKKPKEGEAVPVASVNTPAATEHGDNGV